MASNPFDQFDAEQGNPFDTFDMPQQRSVGQEFKRQAGLVGRMGAETVAALPLAALEGGAGIANLASRAMGGEGNFSFRRQWDAGLDQVFPKPETGAEKAAQILGPVAFGAKIPAPTGVPSVPQNFAGVVKPSEVVLANAQKAGYVVPPTTSNPTALNRVLEGIAGKLTTAQQASAQNMGVTNRLAARSLGLPEDQPITLEAIRQVRQAAAQGYEAIRGAGQIIKDAQFTDDLAKITARFRGAAKDYPGLGSSEVDDIVKAIDVDSAGADSTVDAIAILRERADDAFASGKGSLGKAYKDASRALENLIERNLQGRGKEGADILQRFRDARQLIAKTYSVEKAVNPGTGNVSATKLGQQLGRGKPLSGDLKAAGEFSQAFPKAAREFNESLPGLSPLDFYATGGAAAVTNQPWYLLYPFIRQGVRNALLSPTGQQLLTVPSKGGPVRPEYANALAIGGTSIR